MNTYTELKEGEPVSSVAWRDTEAEAERVSDAIFGQGLTRPLVLRVRDSEWAIIVRRHELNAARWAVLQYERNL